MTTFYAPLANLINLCTKLAVLLYATSLVVEDTWGFVQRNCYTGFSLEVAVVAG